MELKTLPTSRGFRRGKHSAALLHNPDQEVGMAVHGDDFVCLSDDDGLKHVGSLPESGYTTRKTWDSTWALNLT